MVARYEGLRAIQAAAWVVTSGKELMLRGKLLDRITSDGEPAFPPLTRTPCP